MRLCVAKGDVAEFLMNNSPMNPNLAYNSNDVFAVTVDLDCEFLPFHWWGSIRNAGDIRAHLLAVFRRENPYVRVVALALRRGQPKLYW